MFDRFPFLQRPAECNSAIRQIENLRYRRRPALGWWVAGFLCLLAILPATPAGAPAWDVLSDTWVASDALGRALPTFEQVGGPRTNKTVGIFYFLWLGNHGRNLHDITKILGANPSDPKWGPPGAFHFWSEPLFGYYLSDDEFVVRKHAQMLSDAGVDVVIFDVTNGFTYDQTLLKVCQVYTRIRDLGQPTPQIAFLTHSGAPRVAQHLYDTFYAKNLFPDLWFRWQGKPLLLADDRDLSPEVKSFFTLRESWAWSDPQGWFKDGKDKWPWLDHHPQKPGWHEAPDRPEQISVCVAQHPTSNIGRSFRDGRQPAPDQVQPGIGLCFDEQWRRALQVDPEFVFVTGWNEWVAQRFISEKGGQPFLGKPLPAGGTFFVDQFSREFSRDIEPTAGGHGDNYHWQMVDNIRRYKGVHPIPLVRPRPIRIDGGFADWRDVTPEFRDTMGDPAQRNHPGWTGAGVYTNATGRNDLVAAKVSFDARHVHFYVRTRDPLTPCSEPNWMLLFIDADQNPRTGWLGYDFVVNRLGVTPQRTRVERNVGGRYEWAAAGEAALRVAGIELELAVPRKALGLSADAPGVDFKWADNVQQTGHWSDFTLNGDAAPNDRFNYRARFK